MLLKLLDPMHRMTIIRMAKLKAKPNLKLNLQATFHIECPQMTIII